MDIDDVLRQSQLLLKREDEEGSGGSKRVLILMSDTGGGHRASAQVGGGILRTDTSALFNCRCIDKCRKRQPRYSTTAFHEQQRVRR